ncbi:PAS domain S-box protein [Desulfobacula toluolica]|nr:PAS domain S-box protein [Desulfobacula toluolica]
MSSDRQKKNVICESLFKNSHAIMLIIDPESGSIIDANPAALKFYQYSKKELIGMNISKINTLSEQELKQEMENSKLEKRSYFNFHHRLKNGEIRDVEVYSGPVEFNNQKVLYSIVHDITEKNRAQDILKKSESTIRAMINATKSLVYLSDIEGNIINLNTPGALLFNNSPQEMIGKNLNAFFNEPDFSKLKLLMDEVTETHNPIIYQKEHRKRHYEVTLYPVFNKSNQVDRICVFANDITDLKTTEKVFAAIETAGGICNEMTQPLQIIIGNLELLKLNIKNDDPNRLFVNAMLSQAERLGAITKKLTHITRYETKKYTKGNIFDINKSSGIK